MKTSNLFGYILMILLTTTLLAACSKDGYNNSGSSNGSTNNAPTIYMKNSVFSSSSLQVVMGTKVTWNNDDTTVHTVTADNNSFDSGDMQPGASFSQSFNSVGTFPYHCKHHAQMTGSIVVVAKY
jgi:plastocyanin